MQSRAIWDSILMLAIVASVLPVNADASGGNPLSFGKPDFDLTGTVYDATTKQPIDGAYVVALYYKSIVGMAAMDLWCIKTKGMYTGKDGKFRFSIYDADGSFQAMSGANTFDSKEAAAKGLDALKAALTGAKIEFVKGK